MALIEAVKNIFRGENNMVELDAPVSDAFALSRFVSFSPGAIVRLLAPKRTFISWSMLPGESGLDPSRRACDVLEPQGIIRRRMLVLILFQLTSWHDDPTRRLRHNMPVYVS